eukprot:9717572-Lingulodinium_polyedra.AAC.1
MAQQLQSGSLALLGRRSRSSRASAAPVPRAGPGRHSGPRTRAPAAWRLLARQRSSQLATRPQSSQGAR